MRLTTITLLLAILLTGYSSGEIWKTTSLAQVSNQAKEFAPSEQTKESVSDTSSTYKAKFKREISYGSTDEVIVGKIATFAVDDQNRVFIADRDQTTIQVFSPDGSYLTSLGRQGKGPGEFTAVYQRGTTMKLHSNRLFVTDVPEGQVSFPNRVHIFWLEDLSFSHTMKLIPENRNDYEELKGYYPKQIFPLNDGKFLVAYHRSSHEYRDAESVIRYVVQDSAGTIVSGPILEQKDRTYLTYKYPTIEITHMHSFPFLGKSLLAVSGEDRLYAVNNTEAFKIDVYDTSGKHIRTFEHPFNNKTFNKSKVLDRYEKTNYMAKLDRYEGDDVALKMIREADNLPETWPALESMFFDDEDRLWVSTIIDSNEVYEWWVLKNTGAVITQFEWPRGKPIEAVNNGYLYTRETDEETRIQEIVRYRIEMD